ASRYPGIFSSVVSTISFSWPSTTFFTLVVFFTTRSSQSTPVTLEQKSKHSAESTRKNLATATACSLSISNECCCDGLPFGTTSIFAPGTAPSMRDLIWSNDSMDEKAVIPREVEGSRGIASRFRHRIPRDRSAPLGITKRESSLDHRRLKHAGIRGWLQIMFAKLRHGELAWLIWLEKLGLT